MTQLPDKEKRVIAVIAALKLAEGHPIRDWLNGDYVPPAKPGVYLFCLEPTRAGVLQEIDNWFGGDVAIYAGKAEGSGGLRSRLEAHKAKWEQAIANRGLLASSGDEFTEDNLSLRCAVFADEALIAEQTLIDQIHPVAGSPVLVRGGFGGVFSSGQTWTVLGNLAVPKSRTLADRINLVRGHSAPFLANIILIEEFIRDKYYEDLDIQPVP